MEISLFVNFWAFLVTSLATLLWDRENEQSILKNERLFFQKQAVVLEKMSGQF